ncbi:hypothetical protein SERLA73DRAFT_72622 [Serpula lacrymans var. lacrymans S7.3]|uniref:Uncharacterized protein n=1 Tax=Serpula lacrymans var. lacrymans (strain S7.3) TaxID=936435 RepID=F8PVM1_SERL3|nr:hypothetical protein SERLA73DRAFT_72622 [Serpula lacrymans var. lacrymans S7.3]
MASVTPEPSGSASQPDQLRLLQGTTPGLLDSSQSKRVLRFSNSKLHFASFDPRTAYAGDEIPDIRKMSLKEDQPRPKRIVIETTPEGLSSWRFVPRALLEEGVVEEGSWPRVVNICGEHVFCHQDQWDIYKLDPAYKCVVHHGFKYSSISRVELNGPRDTVFFPEAPGAKRSRRPSVERRSPLHGMKRSRPQATDYISSDSDDDDEGEVERMVVDESAHTKKSRDGKDKRRKWSNREELERQRNLRRQKIMKTQLKRTHNSRSNDPNAPAAPDDDMSISDLQGGSKPAENIGKRKGPQVESATDEDTKPDEEQDRARQSGHKRMRTVSPNTVQQALKAMKAEREKRRQDKVHKVDESRRKAREEILLNAIRSDFPVYNNTYTKDHQRSPAGDIVSEEEELQPETISPEQAERENALAESIQKMKELDRDKPLWEAERRKREAREKAEEEEKRAITEERRRAQAERERQQCEEEERLRSFKEECKRQQREEEERVRMAEEETERRKKEEAKWQKEKRRRQRERWGTGLWTSQRALERFKVLSDDFDNAKFSSDFPIAFEDIPWPVLNPPHFSVEDVDWQAVEIFFETVRTHMRIQDYKEFVQKSHRRFHPDRWRARKVWTAVPDELERECLEVAANTVAQALTPIWMDAKSL